MQLPIITCRGEHWFVDVRLRELRRADSWDLTPLRFEEFEEQATGEELSALDDAVAIYKLTRRC